MTNKKQIQALRSIMDEYDFHCNGQSVTEEEYILSFTDVAHGDRLLDFKLSFNRLVMEEE